MNTIQLQHPKRTIFGPGCLNDLAADRLLEASQRCLLLVASPLMPTSEPTIDALRAAGKRVDVFEYSFPGEPTFKQMEEMLFHSQEFQPDCVIGIGGGSVLDCAKLLAALSNSSQKLRDVPGINILKGRNISLLCVPTTSGTGSEMSPNAILLDEQTNEKKGIISPDLVPDAVYIDPTLTLTLPAKLTAETGIDALCHCIEAYTNKFAHPTVDVYALQGIKLIGANLLQACQNGSDLDARTALALGSMYGGLCLGPVNTSAVHALSYGLGGKYHISHGLANAILLPEVLLFNLPASVERTAEIALALGIKKGPDAETTALEGISAIRNLCIACGIPQHLTQIGIQPKDIPELAAIALNVKRLLNNNPREVQLEDAIRIFTQLL